MKPRHTPRSDNWIVSKDAADKMAPAAKRWMRKVAKEIGLELDIDRQVQEIHIRWVYSEKTGEYYFKSWFGEVGVRAKRPVNKAQNKRNKTTSDKIRKGTAGDYYFYYWAHQVTKQIMCGALIDLRRFRKCIDKLPKVPATNRNAMAHEDSDVHFYALKHLAEHGCVVDFRFVEESKIVPGPSNLPSELPANEYQRRQFLRMIAAGEANRPPPKKKRRKARST